MNQKSIPLIIVLALFFGGFLLLGTQSAYAESGDEFVFNAASGTITKYNGSEANLTIPQTIGGVTVKAIGQQAFQGNTALLTVNMPATVNSIGSHAFAQCTNLTTINIPTGVTAIANSTFYKCNSLANINIPDTVISIGDWALADCGSLMSLTFPKSVTSINSTAFNGRSGELIWYVMPGSAAEDYAYSNSINFRFIGETDLGYLFYSKTGTILKYMGSEAKLTIPATIGGAAVKAIGQQAFQGNTALLTVNMPVTVNSIGSHAFDHCTNLTSINIPTGVTAIANNTFYQCNSLVNVNIPATVTAIGDWAFAGCGSLKSLTFPKSVSSINSTAFNGRSNALTWYVMPGSAAEDYAYSNSINFRFIGETDLGYLFYSKTGTILKYMGSEANLTIPATIGGVAVKAIGQQAFQGNTALLTVNMPATVNFIGIHAFDHCTNLTTINIPTGVTAIANSTFNKCNSLANINIPDTVISIGDWALADCGSLKSLTLPKSVTSINSTAFNGRSGELIWYVMPGSAAEDYAYSNNINFRFISEADLGYLFYSKTGTILNYMGSEAELTIPETIGGVTVKAIGQQAFQGNTALLTVNMPATVNSIGSHAFAQCTNLTTINIPTGVTAIANSTFYKCNSLANINIPDTVISIGDWALADCGSLKSLTLPNSVTSINSTAVNGRSGELTWYVMPGSAAEDYAYSNNINFRFIGEADLGYLFYSKTGTILRYMGSEADLTIPATIGGVAVKAIGQQAFQGNTALLTVNMPATVNSIGSHAFAQCTNLTTINIPTGVTAIANSTFYKCNSLAHINIPDTVISIGDWALADCGSLMSLTFPKSVTSINSTAFNGRSSQLTWYVAEASAAHLYAQKNNINFVLITFPWAELDSILVTLTSEQIASLDAAYSTWSAITPAEMFVLFEDLYTPEVQHRLGINSNAYMALHDIAKIRIYDETNRDSQLNDYVSQYLSSFNSILGTEISHSQLCELIIDEFTKMVALLKDDGFPQNKINSAEALKDFGLSAFNKVIAQEENEGLRTELTALGW